MLTWLLLILCQLIYWGSGEVKIGNDIAAGLHSGGGILGRKWHLLNACRSLNNWCGVGQNSGAVKYLFSHEINSR